MTREEEIKDKLETYQAKYIHWQSGRQLDSAEDDIEYLLARNEELQRRMEKMRAVVDAAREGFVNCYGSLDAASNAHIHRPLDDDEARLLAEILKLDAKDRDYESIHH